MVSGYDKNAPPSPELHPGPGAKYVFIGFLVLVISVVLAIFRYA